MRMLLAVDTATKVTGIALHDGFEVLAEHIWRSDDYHTVELAPEVALMLRRAKVQPGALTGVAVASGPGSYTGLRIGMALAKGIALSRGLPLFGVPTLSILAAEQPRSDLPLLAVMRAGRGRFAAGWYAWGKGGWQPVAPPGNLRWETLLSRLDRPTRVAGELTPKERQQMARRSGIDLAPPALCVRRPAVLAEIAWSRLRSGERPDPAELAPTYIGSLTD
jgi:tRNA threonylcarbamoyladenosine biosynthesis protein TsaB